MEIIGKYIETHLWSYLMFATIVCLLMIYWAFRKNFSKEIIIVIALSYCYPLGEFFQSSHMGLQLVRNHLSDFGGVFLGITIIIPFLMPPINKKTLIKLLSISLVWSIILIGHESMQIYMNTKGFTHQNMGDIYDVVTYIIAETIALICIGICIKEIHYQEIKMLVRKRHTKPQNKNLWKTKS